MDYEPIVNELIFALSAKGKISFSDFNVILEVLYYEKGFAQNDAINWNDVIRDTRRFLESLGYCDVDYDDGKIYACPPALVLLPKNGLPSAILTGTYTPDVLIKLENFAKSHNDVCNFDWLQHPIEKIVSAFIPKTFCITAESTDLIETMAKDADIDIQISSSAANLLLKFSCSSTDIWENLEFTERILPLEPKGCNKTEFNISELRFSSSNYSFENFRLAQYRQTNNRYKLMFWMWNGNEKADVDLNWGRWLLLHKANKNVMVYDYLHRQLLCPSSVPLPRLLARAMTLCSGTIPHQEILFYENDSFKRIIKQNEGGNAFSFDVYDQVSKPMADELRNKLGQSVIHLLSFKLFD